MVLSKTDPAAALRLCEKEELTQRQPLVASTVFQYFAAVSPEAAYRWAAALPEGQLREYCVPRLFNEMARHAPALAGNIVIASAGGPNGAPDKFIKMIDRWGEIAPANAALWLESQNQASWQLVSGHFKTSHPEGELVIGLARV